MTQGVVLARGVVAVDGDTGGTTPGTLYAYGLYAAMPAASAFTGQYYFATDIGVNGIMVYSNGTTRTAAWPQVLARSAVPVSAAADTTENTLATITIPAGLMGLSGGLRINGVWTYTNSGNNKTPRVRFGGAAGTAYQSTVATTTASARWPLNIQNRNSASSQIGGVAASANGPVGLSAASNVTSTVDTSAETTLVFTGQKASAGETITLESYIVEILP
jgi:hypothetical protein